MHCRMSVKLALIFIFLSTNYREKVAPQPLRQQTGGNVGTRNSRGQSVLFSNDPRITQAHKDTVRRTNLLQNSVLLAFAFECMS